uniref:Aldehyde oxidase-3 n=1 Tax=Plutella xylostella TaxID=51655 RepID=A0A1L8D6P5_PLUXY
MDCIEFSVNGRKCRVTSSLPRETTLNAYLRYHLALPGTKSMCQEGGCGACIVSVRAAGASGEVEVFAVNSCLVLVFSCQGWDITTVEGAGGRAGGYSQVQKRIAAFNGSQCGYCTPGWVMALTSLLDKHLTMEELEKSFGSNTCRCTGFRPILDTIKSFAIDASPELKTRVAAIEDIEDIPYCKKANRICDRKCSEASNDSDWSIVCAPKEVPRKAIELDFGKTKFHKVFDEEHVFDILKREGYDSYMFVSGNTGKGLLESYEYPRILIDISDVRSLKGHLIDQNLIIGANTNLEDAMEIFKEGSRKPEFAYLEAFVEHFEKIAHIPVRKIGCLAGNLMMKKAVPTFQSDVFLLFSCVRATVTIRYANGTRISVPIVQFLKSSSVAMLLVSIELPPLSPRHIFKSYKIMPRHQNALAIVNAAFMLKLSDGDSEIEAASITYGNIRPDFYHASYTEEFLKGKDAFDNKTVQGAIKMLKHEILPDDCPPEACPEARKKLAIGLFYKFILSITPHSQISPCYKTGGEHIKRPLSQGMQDFQTDPSLYPLNQPVTKLEAQIQASGEAQYVNDIPPLPREVFGAFVLSTVHIGEVDHIDASDVLETEGVVALYTPKDIPGINSFTKPGFQLLTENEEILATKIKYYGQPIAIIVATTAELAQREAKKVKVTYKNVSTEDPVLTIEQAKKDSKRLIPSDAAIEPVRRGTNVQKVVKGVFELEAQYHYYLEPVTCVVIPVDNGLEVYDSTQWIDLTQISIAQCLKMNECDIQVKVRRLGGGFGGKITRNAQVATACALVAKILDTPCRFILPIQTNLTICGKRLPCQTEYEVGVDKDGKIQYLEASIFEDQGCSRNEDILSYTVDGFPNCYNKDFWRVRSANVLTDLCSNTFMRAPGDLEGIATIEHIMEHIAFEVEKDPTEVRLANMRNEDKDIPELIEKMKMLTEYEKRFRAIKEYNQTNRWMKKAIKINVMLFPVMYYGNYSAFVSIYRGDGTVTVSTGGVEMGQGINTKAAQVCAFTLGVPLHCVSIIPNHSFVCANNVFSGSSITSESVCYSIIKACEILKKRLEPVRQKLANPSWFKLIQQAGADQVDLTAEYMMNDMEPDLKSYSAFAVNVIETQMDVLTGRFEILRADVLEDVGLSANPQVDVGQVEGAYVQGIGYYTSEKMVYDLKTGKLLTNRSLNYHVPLALDIPADFRISLRYNSKNPKGVLGSKAVGEMGACTAVGVIFALRECIQESRRDSGYAHQWINIGKRGLV